MVTVPTPRADPSTNIAADLFSLLPHERQLRDHVLLPDNFDLYRAHFIQIHVALGSDGSIKNGRCSFSWTLAFTSFSSSPRITAHALEDPSDTSTARVEALGHLGALYFIRSISRFLCIPSEALANSEVHAFIDNMAVIHRFRNPSYKILKSALAADFDVTNEICLVLSELSTSILRHHVKSHEHDDELLEDFSLPAKLNRVCDIACEAAYSCHTCSALPPPPLSFPSTRCIIIISGRRYTGKSRNFLRRQVSQLETKSYILEQEVWNPALFDSVSWDSLDTAMARCNDTPVAPPW